MLELWPDPHEGLPRIERLAHDLQERGPLLQNLQQLLVDVQLLDAEVFEQPDCSPDVEALALRGERLPEERLDRLQERPLGRAEAGVVEPPKEQVTPELEPRDPFVEVLRRPVGEARIDGLGE